MKIVISFPFNETISRFFKRHVLSCRSFVAFVFIDCHNCQSMPTIYLASHIAGFFYVCAMSQINITDDMLEYVAANLHGIMDVRAIAMLMVKYHKQQQTAQATGNRPTEPKCALSNNARSPADDTQMQKMRARAWHEQGVLMVEPYKMALSLERDWLICLAESKYGERKTVA